MGRCSIAWSRSRQAQRAPNGLIEVVLQGDNLHGWDLISTGESVSYHAEDDRYLTFIGERAAYNRMRVENDRHGRELLYVATAIHGESNGQGHWYTGWLLIGTKA